MRYLNTDNLNKDRHFNEDLKQVQVNTYYYKRYKSENQLLYFIMVISFILISIALIKKRFAFFDDLSYSIIVGIIMGIALLYISHCIYGLIHKDKLNYDEDEYLYDDSNLDLSGNANYECLKHGYSYSIV
jgi:Cys-tRNA synthase (O-phospho-L-seryl-tRNA:Cys-tRNA synthase)